MNINLQNTVKYIARKRYSFGYIFSLIIAVFNTNNACSQGDLLITPRRIVFEDDRKIQQINLANIGTDTARYVLTSVEIRMNEDGSFENITDPDPGQQFATPYLRFFPRSVVLAPNESQLLKVQLTKTNMLSNGEYRSHVYFRAVNEERPLGEIEAMVDSSSISVSLVPVFGITIPVIIRVGPYDATASINNISLHQKDTVSFVKMVIERSGNMSVYGDIKAEFTDETGKVSKIGQANGVAVYTPTAKRSFTLPLQHDVRNMKGTLMVKYVTHDEKNQVIIAQSEIKTGITGQQSIYIEK